MNRRLVVVTVLAALTRCALPGKPASTQALRILPAVQAGAVAAAGESSSDFQVQVACSETALRTPIALLTWRGGPGARSSQRIDVTVFKEGFARGQYASVNAAAGGAFIPAPALRSMPRSGGRAMRPFEMAARLRSGSRPGEHRPALLETVVEVRNLEPELLYQWRLVDRTAPGAIPSHTITVEAPVCIADEAREED